MYKWQPSKTAKKAFAVKMAEIESFCCENGIEQSRSGDSYYFQLNGQHYRVSNHSVEASNAASTDELTGEKKRDVYHPNGRESNVFYIHAGKTRIIEIYTAIKSGMTVDYRGYVISQGG